MRSGPSGPDIILKLPVGTQILNEDGDIVLADLTEIGQRITLARGGDGGRGNTAFKSSTNQHRAAPIRAFRDGHVDLVAAQADRRCGAGGLPNAGKSTFLAARSAARPKIADYPFTTLHPGLGVVAVDDHEFVMADIPGLVEGAHEGTGLGHRFLGHVERRQVLLHLVDGTADDPVGNWQIIRRELAKYDATLAEKTEITAISKIDAMDPETVAEVSAGLQDAGAEMIMPLSAISGEGYAGSDAAALAGDRCSTHCRSRR